MPTTQIANCLSLRSLPRTSLRHSRAQNGPTTFCGALRRTSSAPRGSQLFWRTRSSNRDLRLRRLALVVTLGQRLVQGWESPQIDFPFSKRPSQSSGGAPELPILHYSRILRRDSQSTHNWISSGRCLEHGGRPRRHQTSQLPCQDFNPRGKSSRGVTHIRQVRSRA